MYKQPAMSIRKSFKRANSGSKSPPDSFRFFLAARHNQVHVLREILEQHDDAVTWREGGRTALLIAVEQGNFMAAQVLLTHHAEPALLQGKEPLLAQGDAGTTPLHAAAKIDRADLAGMLLHHRAPVDALRGGKNTALMDAIYWDSRKAAASLLKFGASTTKQNSDGDAALHIAAERDYPEAAALLLDNGADIDARNASGWTAMMIAADNGRLETCKLLLDRGCDPHLKNPKGKTALDLGLAHGGNDPEFVEDFGRAVYARYRKDAATMGIPFTEGTDHSVSVRKPLKLRRKRKVPPKP
jgi:ankyrin repeat protein